MRPERRECRRIKGRDRFIIGGVHLRRRFSVVGWTQTKRGWCKKTRSIQEGRALRWAVFVTMGRDNGGSHGRGKGNGRERKRQNCEENEGSRKSNLERETYSWSRDRQRAQRAWVPYTAMLTARKRVGDGGLGSAKEQS